MGSPPFPDDDVDPEIRTWLIRMFAASRALGSGPDTPIAQLRANAERQREPWRTGGPAMRESRELTIAGYRCRIHYPVAAEALPVLIYLHGGGWVLFSIDTHDRLMREYAARARVAVLGIDYPLAPEHPFPAACNAIAEVLDWVQAEGAAHGLDAGRFAIGGDSAGANLSVSAALRLRDGAKPMPSALLLNYGAFDGAHRPSFERYGDPDRYMLTGPEMDAFWETYLAGAPADVPLARVFNADLADLPPAWLCVARCDVLLDENVELARRLRQSGNEAELRVYDGATHSFLEAAEISSLADRALAEASAWLADRLGSAPRA